MAPDNPTAPASTGKALGSVFEGAAHVLHGLEQQRDFWRNLEDHDAAKREMLPALTEAAAALRAALKRAEACPP